MLAQKLMENQTEAVVQTVIDAALTGDMQACKLIVERLLPPAKERAIQADLKLPATITTENAPLVFAAILKATASGGLCPGEGETLQRMMQMYLTAVEYTTLTRRIEELEARQDGGQAW